MSKPNKNRTKFYEAYKREDRRTRNKKRKEARRKKHEEHLQKRREEGTAAKNKELKTANPDAFTTDNKPKNLTRYAKMKSLLAKLDYQNSKKEKADKLLLSKSKGKKGENE